MNAASRYRTRVNIHKVIAFSVSWQRTNLLSRGLGLEHLKELLIRLARPILRTGANLAYGGQWKESEDNFTYELLKLINAEKEGNSHTDPANDKVEIGILYNHSAWPNYLSVTPRIEAQWIKCCRIVRITQEMAGIPKERIVADSQANADSAPVRVNAALTLSAMRRLMMEPMLIPIADIGAAESIHPVAARIILGGKVDDYSGFLPGIYEEALLTLRARRPLFILGGFGGATESLARAVTEPNGGASEQFTLEWQRQHNPKLSKLLEDAGNVGLPPDWTPPEVALQDLAARLQAAKQGSPAEVLSTGLTDDETRKLIGTSDIHLAVKLVKRGLSNLRMLPSLAA